MDNSDNIGLIIELVFSIGVAALLLGLGFFAGRWAEKRHLGSLAKREQEFAAMLVCDLKSFPVGGDATGVDGAGHGRLVLGEAVISSDYFKTFLSAWRKIVGGEMKNYRLLLERARREATLRMLADARKHGFDAVCNVRYNGYDIAAGIKAGNNKPIVSVAVQASGTAYRLKRV